jgi:hypothetical protein
MSDDETLIPAKVKDLEQAFTQIGSLNDYHTEGKLINHDGKLFAIGGTHNNHKAELYDAAIDKWIAIESRVSKDFLQSFFDPIVPTQDVIYLQKDYSF